MFDASEVNSRKIERYRILIDRDRVAELIANVYRETHQQATLRPEALENLCLVIWSAWELHARGELLHARQYIDGFAINQLLNLLYSEPATSVRMLWTRAGVLNCERRSWQRSCLISTPNRYRTPRFAYSRSSNAN